MKCDEGHIFSVKEGKIVRNDNASTRVHLPRIWLFILAIQILLNVILVKFIDTKDTKIVIIMTELLLS